jgi:hypothetical protein
MSVGGARLQGNVRTRLNERSRRNSRGTVAAGQHPGARLRGLSPRIAMVKTAEAWQRSQSGVGNWSWLDRTSAGSVFVQGVVNAVLVVIADVLADDTTKVFFVPRDDVVEDLAAAAPNPSFGRSVLPWGVNARSFGFQSGGRQEANDVAVEDGIVIQNGVAIGGRLRKGFAKLLHDPICGRMSRDVEMQDSTAFVLDDEETVQHSETRGRNGEEVEGDDGLAVVVKKCEPFLGCVAAPLRSREIAGDGSLGQDKPSFCSSPWILGAPQPVFSWAKRQINARSSGVILGRPPRRRDVQRQYRRKPARCQPTTVSGLTITNASRQ